MVRLLRALPGTVADWAALTSLISVRELARLVVATGLARVADLTAAVYHATDPTPVPVATLLHTISDCVSLGLPADTLTLAEAQAAVESDPRLRNALDMLSSDHWFDGAQLWKDLALGPGRDFSSEFAASAEWYRQTLASI